MTVASLVVELSANAARFHDEMEKAARTVERTGRTIARAGHEISLAISLPILAVKAAAFAALLEDSARHFGPLSTAVNGLKAATRELFVAIGRELEPVFLATIAALRAGIDILRNWIDAFRTLPPWIQKTVIYTLSFLAALGPTVLVVGKVIAAVGALGKVLGLLVSPAGLAVVAILALAAAAIYTATHWDRVKELLLEDVAAIVQGFFLLARLSVLLVDITTLGITKLAGATDYLRGKLDAMEDSALGKLGGLISEANDKLARLTQGFHQHAVVVASVRDAIDKYNEGMRQLALNVATIGPRFNAFAKQAELLKQEIDAITAAGPAAQAQFESMVMPLADLAAMWAKASDAAQVYGQALGEVANGVMSFAQASDVADRVARGITTLSVALSELQARAAVVDTIRKGIAGAFEALGTRLGQIFAGMTHGFHGFGKVMEGILGGMLVTLGQILIAYGTAGIKIRQFITNPYAAVAAGIALVALGTALSAAAQNTLSGSSGGGAPAAAAGSSSSSASPSQGSGTIVLEFHGGRADFSDPRDQDILAQALRDLSGRNVQVVYAPS